MVIQPGSPCIRVPAMRSLSCAFFLFLNPALLMMNVVPTLAEAAVADYFSDTYKEARSKFLVAAIRAGGNLEHYRNPNLGIEGEELFTDVATFNLPGAKSVLVLGSGTHGVEGFAGSAVQVGLLREGFTENLPGDTGLLFYHALNPYGFSHLRRFNEDNVDLNRNFVDHSKAYPPNPAYNELAGLIEPDALSTWQDIRARLVLAWYRITKGKLWLQTAISQGQYEHPKGLFFGGNAKTWSNHTLQRIIDRHLTLVSRVVLIDFHTGLGEYRAAEVIAGAGPGNPSDERMLKWWGNRVKTPDAGDAVSPPISGSLKHGFIRLLPGVDVTAVSLEFGTSPLSEVLWALRAENYLHHHGSMALADAPAIKAEIKRVFYPDTADWKRAVWRQAKEVVGQVLPPRVLKNP